MFYVLTLFDHLVYRRLDLQEADLVYILRLKILSATIRFAMAKRIVLR